MFLLSTDNAVWVVGITDIPKSRTIGPSGVGFGAGKTNTRPPDSRTAPTVLGR